MRENESPTLQPKEQNLKESRRLLQQISHVLVTPFPGLGCGLSFKNTIFALLIMYVWTHDMSMYFWISLTLTTLWYEERLIYKTNQPNKILQITFLVSYIKITIRKRRNEKKKKKTWTTRWSLWLIKQ